MGSLRLWGVGRRKGSPTPTKPLRNKIRLWFSWDNLMILASLGLETIVVVEELRGPWDPRTTMNQVTCLVENFFTSIPRSCCPLIHLT